MNCRIVVNEFELRLSYYVQFWSNTLGKGMNPLILPAMGWIVPLLFFQKSGFGIKKRNQRNQTKKSDHYNKPDHYNKSDYYNKSAYYLLIIIDLTIIIYEVRTISFKTFFIWALLLIVHNWNSSSLQSNCLRLQCTCSTIPTTSGRPHWSPLV